MANKKIVDNNNAENNNSSTILEENKKLKQELEELKKMLQQLTSSQSLKTENEVVNKDEDELEIDDNIAIIPPNKLINITSLFYGGMTLKASNNKPIRFETFGLTRPVTFEDLTYITGNHRNLAEEVAFFIHDKDARKALYLDKYYNNKISKKTIEDIISLDMNQIQEIYNSLTNILKETVVDIIIQGIKSGDRKYADRTKIDFISKLCGKNLYKIAQDEIIDE